MTPEQSLSASSTSFSVIIATVNISNSYEKSTEPEDLAVKMLTEKGKIYKICSKWRPFIRTQARSRFLHSSMASSMTVCKSLTIHESGAASARWRHV